MYPFVSDAEDNCPLTGSYSHVLQSCSDLPAPFGQRPDSLNGISDRGFRESRHGVTDLCLQFGLGIVVLVLGQIA